PPPPLTLFPYTTLFRSVRHAAPRRPRSSRRLVPTLHGRPPGVPVLRTRLLVAAGPGATADARRPQHDRSHEGPHGGVVRHARARSEEHTSELQSRFDLV